MRFLDRQMSTKLLVFNLELNFEQVQVSEHLPPNDWPPIHLLQSQRNSRLFPPWTTSWETRRGGADESVRWRTPSPTLLLRSLILLLPEEDQPPHEPACIMCPRKRVKTDVVGLSSRMADSPQQQEDETLSIVSNMSNGPGLNSVESRLGQISATLESLSTELAILIASRRRGEGDNMLLKEVESPSMEMVMESNKTTKGGSSVVESAGGFRTSSAVRLNVGGKVFHVSWDLLQQVSNIQSCFIFTTVEQFKTA